MTDDMWPLTGLPHLPDGYFWRITQDKPYDYSNVTYPNIEIRRRTWVSSRFVVWSWFYTPDDIRKYANLVENALSNASHAVDKVDDLTPETIRATAVELRAEFQKIRDRKVRTAELMGDYPPKKLEV